jgi:anthranilate synthase component 2
MKKLLVIDNFDSFTYNLVQYFGQSGAACDVIRNNQLSLEEIDISPFDGIVLSPGPCDPDRAGISLSAVKAWEGKKTFTWGMSWASVYCSGIWRKHC